MAFNVQYLTPFIGAFIGWVTNYIAVLMLFHPHKEKRILGIPFQGVFPRRQHEFAEKMGHLVAQELFTVDDVTARMKTLATSVENLQTLRDKIEAVALRRLTEEIPALAYVLRPRHIHHMLEYITVDLHRLIAQMSDQLSQRLHNELDVQRIVEEKISAFSSEKLEEIVFSIMRKEFRSIEVVGGILGFLIGLIQLALAL